jgi:phosphomannomutase/phosphoglucomutase
MITASHNPPEFNGVKVIAPDGVEIPRSTENAIEEKFFSEDPQYATWDQIKEVKSLSIFDEYISAVKSHVEIEQIRASKLKIAIDSGNGVSALIAPRLARELGCEVFTINVNIDGHFPGRESEPRPDNLSGLQALVKATGADLGIAFDGDGDRSVFVDEKGEVQWGDRTVALLAKEFITRKKGNKIASAVNSSRTLEEVVTQNGGSMVWTQVGSVVISRIMVNEGIMFGGEENGGIFYGPHLQVRDGCMAMALMLEALARSESSFSEMLSELPRYHQLKDKVSCPENLKQKVLESLKTQAKAPKIETIDGVKLTYTDGSWILFRPSGTEPIYRIYAEAETLERVTELMEDHKSLIETVVDLLK